MYYLVKKRGEVPVYTVEAYRGSRGIVPLILNMEVSDQHNSPPLYHGRYSSTIQTERWVGPRAGLDDL